MADDESKTAKVVIAPGAFDEIAADLTEEEMNELMAQIQQVAADILAGGDLSQHNVRVVNLADLEESDPELFEALASQLEKLDPDMLDSILGEEGGGIHELPLPAIAPGKKTLH